MSLGLVGLGVAASAGAQDRFEAAERARAEARLEEAEQGYRSALESGELTLSEVAHAHLRLAELAFLGEELDAGSRHLRYALSLRADAPVAEGPQGMQDAAAAILVERSQRTLRAVVEVSDPSAPLRIDVRDAPDGLVRTIEVAGPAGFHRTLGWDGEARELDPPVEARPIGVRLLDVHGNRIGSAGVWPSPPAAVPPPPPNTPIPVVETGEPEGEEGGDDALENPWLWVAIGVVLVVAGIAVGFSASGDRFTLGAPVAP